MWAVWLCLLAIQAGHRLQAQADTYAFLHMGKQEGLSYSEVTCLHQDRLGYVWLGTWDGLCRYDGYSLECWHSSNDGKGNLPFNEITSICDGPDGNLWIGTAHGPAFLDRRSYTVGDPAAANAAIACLLELSPHNRHEMSQDLEGNLWDLVDHDYGPPRALLHTVPGQACEPERVHAQASKVLHTRAGTWVAPDQGIAFHPLHGSVPGSQAAIEKRLSSVAIVQMAADAQGNLWLASADSLYLADCKGTGVQPHALPPGVTGTATCLLADRQGSLWMGTTSGLWVLHLASGNWQRLHHDAADPYSLSHDHITCLLQDRSGTLWVGTRGGGVDRLQLGGLPFHHLLSSHPALGQGTEVFCMAEQPDGLVWLGTSKGLLLWDKGNASAHGEMMPVPGSGGNEDVTAIALLRDGGLLVGTRSRGLWQCLLPQKSWRQLPNPQSTVPPHLDVVRSLQQAPSGDVWIARASGAYRLPRGSSTAVVLHADTPYFGSNAPKAKRTYTWTVRQTADGWLHIGSGGVDAWHPRLGAFPNMTELMDSAVRHSRNNDALCVHPLANGACLVGTYGHGIFLHDPQRHRLCRFSTSQGLPNGYVYGILRAADGTLWCSTNQGLASWHPREGKVRAYGPEDGLLVQEFESNSSLLCRDGTLMFGGNNGLVWFDPLDMRLEEPQPPPMPVLSQLWVRGQPRTLDSCISDLRVLTLQPGETQVSLSLFSPDLWRAGQMEYRYRLLPEETQWTAHSGSTEASYRNLAPGDHTLEVMAVSPTGLASEVRRLTLRVLPAWHERTWVRALLVLLGSGLLTLLVSLRMRLVRERALKVAAEKEWDLDKQLLKMRMDQHFTFNALNSIQHFLLQHEGDKAQEYLARFGKLIRQTLKVTGERFHTLADELEMLQLYLDLETLRGNGAFTARLEVDPGLDTYAVLVPPMLAQPLIENAIWHGLMPRKRTDGLLTVQVRQENGLLVWRILDNGIGRQQAQAHRAASKLQREGKGIALVRKTLSLLPGGQSSLSYQDLTDAQGQPLGTLAEIRIPIHHDA